MESFFDFLFSNIALLVIIIGVISTFVGKWRNGTSEGEVKRKRIPEIIRETMSEYNQEKPKQWPNGQPVARTELHVPQKKLEAGELEAKLKQARDITEQKLPETRPMIHTPILDTESPVYKPDLRFDREKLIDGIIMSEVLGPPKSKINKRRQ
jgi:hypothetical protein